MYRRAKVVGTRIDNKVEEVIDFLRDNYPVEGYVNLRSPEVREFNKDDFDEVREFNKDGFDIDRVASELFIFEMESILLRDMFRYSFSSTVKTQNYHTIILNGIKTGIDHKKYHKSL